MDRRQLLKTLSLTPLAFLVPTSIAFGLPKPKQTEFKFVQSYDSKTKEGKVELFITWAEEEGTYYISVKVVGPSSRDEGHPLWEVARNCLMRAVSWEKSYARHAVAEHPNFRTKLTEGCKQCMAFEAGHAASRCKIGKAAWRKKEQGWKPQVGDYY